MLTAGFVFIIGLIIGSFLNVAIIRLPLQISTITPRSFCQNCKKTIAWYDNIPLISYLVLKGRCRNCDAKISIQYPIVELLTALVTILLYFKLTLTIEFIQICILFYLLIVLSFIDLKYKAVPDYLLLLILLNSIFLLPLDFSHLRDGMLFAGGFILLNFVVTFYIQNIKSKLTNDESLQTQEALGEGDIPIVAAIGAVLGIISGFFAIFLSALFAILPSIYNKAVKKDSQTPFIPFLSLGFAVEYLFQVSGLLQL